MANKNRSECDCLGFYDGVGGCTPVLPTTDPAYVDPCPPTWFETAGTWDWNNISSTALNWGYALGLFNNPNTINMETQQYMLELQRQKQQMMYIMVGVGLIMVLVVIVVLRKKK
tara:strand:- start:3959 stop:4300 length:342 start_codon:yes stop_codon:yes gene_type:complete